MAKLKSTEIYGKLKVSGKSELRDLTVTGKASVLTLNNVDLTYNRASSVLTTAAVFSNIVVENGIVTAIGTRNLTAANIGAAATGHGHDDLHANTQAAHTWYTKASIEGLLTGAITTHTHAYLQLTGGTLTGLLTLASAFTGNRGVINIPNVGTVDPSASVAGDLWHRSNVFRYKDGAGTVRQLAHTGTWGVMTAAQLTTGTATTTQFVTAKNIRDSLNAIYAPISHAHGDITNTGTITSDTAHANGFKFVMTDGSGNIVRSSIARGTVTTTYLRNDGAWGTPPGTYSHPTGGANTTISAANQIVLSAITVNSLGHVTSVSSKTLVAADIPTLNQNTTGTAGSVSNALSAGTNLNFTGGGTYNGSAAKTVNLDNSITLSGTVQSGGVFNMGTQATMSYNSTSKTIDFIFN